MTPGVTRNILVAYEGRFFGVALLASGESNYGVRAAMQSVAQNHLYRPQQIPPESLEALFVARGPLVQEVLTKLDQWQAPAPRPHYLLVGPHGSGKTFLLHILRHRIRKGPLSQSWVPVVLPEEGYGLRSVPNLFVQGLEVLGQETLDGDVLRIHEEVRSDADDQRALVLALDGFRSFYERTGRRVVLTVENLDRVLDGPLGSRTQLPLLRKILVREDWLVLIATSLADVGAIADPEKPLHDFFETRQLPDLTLEEQGAMLKKLAVQNGRVEADELLRRARPHLQALHHFTGGSPRLTAMLHGLISQKSAVEGLPEFEALLDMLTPFCRDRMGALAGQEAQLLERMALLPEGCTPTELAHHARMPAKIVRSLLIRLEKAGLVSHEPRRRRKTIYVIQDRPFRIWHQQGHSQDARRRLQHLFDFFHAWYAGRGKGGHTSDDSLEKPDPRLSEQDENRERDLAEYMSLAPIVIDGKLKHEREFDALRHMVKRKGLEALGPRFNELDQERKDDGSYFVEKGRFLFEVAQDLQGALAAFHTACSLAPHDPVALYNRAVAIDKQGGSKRAEKEYKKAAMHLAALGSGRKSGDAGALLVEILKSSRSRLYVEMAAGLLGRLRARRRAMEIVSIATASQAEWRRRHCAHALGLLGGPRAVQCLLDMLSDPAIEVRSAAARALGHLGAHEATVPIAGCLSDTSDVVRVSAVTALSHIQSSEAAGALIACLHHESSDIRASAATGLGRMGSTEAVVPLVACLQDSADDVRGSAAFALGLLHCQAAITPLIVCLRHNADMVRRSAAFALGLIGSEEAARPLITCLSDEVSKVRGSAATALGSIRSKEAVESLLACLGDGEAQVRRNAATALGLIGSGRIVAPLIACLHDDASDVRSSAVTAVGRIGAQEAAVPLITSLREEGTPVRGKVATALGRIGSPQAIGPLLEMACTVKGRDGQCALNALVELIGDHPVPELADVLKIILSKPPTTPEQRVEIGRTCLRSAFSSSDADLAQRCVDVAVGHIDNGAEIFKPYVVACEYTRSERNPAVLERQHPEMREAAGLLIAHFDRSE